LLVLLMTCLGLYGGTRFYAATLRPTPDLRWLGAPPQPIQELVAAHFDTVYVRTTDQTLYRCSWSSPYDIACWVPIAAIPTIRPDRCWRDQAPPPTLPSGTAIDVLQFHYCGSFAGITDCSSFNYYLLTDGTVVQWGADEFHIGLPPMMTLKWLSNAFAGMMVGFLGGHLLVRALGRWAPQRQRSPNE
jgi:hypothetical protein